MAMGATWGDSFDPGDTYYGYSWDLLRNYARSLVMFKPAPGKQGLQLVPDIATDLGKSSDGGKTWTYTIQKGLKFEDGSPITTKDIAYAVVAHRRPGRAQAGARPTSPTCSTGRRATRVPSRVRRTPTSPRRSRRPNDTTIVFHLKQPFAEFDYLAAAAADGTGPAGQGHRARSTPTHPISSGPYMWKGNTDIATGGTLVRNPNWDASTDPNRKALPGPDRRQARPAGRRPGQPDHRRRPGRRHRRHRRAAGGTAEGAAAEGPAGPRRQPDRRA